MFFFDRAFRAFFLGGSLFAVSAMAIWWLVYPDSSHLFSGVQPIYWHAHEMVFGYALATVTGFLLTAAMNWSGMHSASGVKLAVLFFFWVAARLGYWVNLPIFWVAVLDMAFSVGLFLHFFWPVYRQKLWAQTGLAAKFLLLVLANGWFYAGATGWLAHGQLTGVLLGLFLVLAINLTMMRRLMPFFTEKALGLTPFRQSKRLDILALAGFLALMVCAVFWPDHWVTSVIAFPLVLVHGIRLSRWYHPDIWRQVLLWPMFVSYGFMILGMLAYGLVGLKWLEATIAIHALAAGGIGLLCASIMARISLGHTQRNVFDPPKAVAWVFGILVVTAIVRVGFPVLMPANYIFWMHLSQLGWGVAFLVLAVTYWPILTRPSPPRDAGIRL
ncbi:MAG: NnrS family protein [Hydrogenovibrio sp.]|nr:NnrS family protein [Hydrogenovibrio sp.]